MMLQGHFISSLLANKFKDTNNTAYQIWDYFRGITAPVFFTITGFVFFFLVLKDKSIGNKNKRIQKGLTRGLKLIGWGYLLRFGIGSLLFGYYHESYFYTDVLQIIGVSILVLCMLYLALHKYKILGITLFIITILSFLFERMYNGMQISYVPVVLSHYFTNVNGAVFSLFPWFGYVSMGAFLAILFVKHQDDENFYFVMPMYLGVSGLFLMYFSSPVLFYLHQITGIDIFIISAEYNYLFARLGDVLVLFTLFVYARNFIKHPIFIEIGKVTLSVYIVHHIILYGSWFNTGIIRIYYNSLTLTQSLIGAIIFMILVTYLVLKYRNVVNNFIAEIQLKINYQYRVAKVVFTRR